MATIDRLDAAAQRFGKVGSHIEAEGRYSSSQTIDAEWNLQALQERREAEIDQKQLHQHRGAAEEVDIDAAGPMGHTPWGLQQHRQTSAANQTEAKGKSGENQRDGSPLQQVGEEQRHVQPGHRGVGFLQIGGFFREAGWISCKPTAIKLAITTAFDQSIDALIDRGCERRIGGQCNAVILRAQMFTRNMNTCQFGLIDGIENPRHITHHGIGIAIHELLQSKGS